MLARLHPIALESIWFHEGEAWRYLMTESDNSEGGHPENPFQPDAPLKEVLRPIFRLVNDYDRSLHQILADGQGNKLKDMVMPTLEATPEEKYLKVHHLLMLMQLMDRLIWAYHAVGDPGQLEAAADAPYTFATECNSSSNSSLTSQFSTKVLESGRKNWLETTQDFVKAWGAKMDIDEEPEQTEDPIHSLFLKWNRAEDATHVIQVESNLCGAAIGLRALLSVSHRTDMQCSPSNYKHHHKYTGEKEVQSKTWGQRLM